MPRPRKHPTPSGKRVRTVPEQEELSTVTIVCDQLGRRVQVTPEDRRILVAVTLTARFGIDLSKGWVDAVVSEVLVICRREQFGLGDSFTSTPSERWTIPATFDVTLKAVTESARVDGTRIAAAIRDLLSDACRMTPQLRDVGITLTYYQPAPSAI